MIHRLSVPLLFVMTACMGLAQAPAKAPAALPALAPAAAPATNQIRLDVVVTPKNGAPVAGLKEGNFTLLDNKVPRKLTSFREADKKEPVRVIILVDAVNLGYMGVANVRQHMDALFQANGGKLAQPMRMAFFTDTGTQIQQGYTTDGKGLSEALDQYELGLRTLRRSTGFFGAEDRLQLSLKTMRDLITVESREPGRKLVLWISPGWPYFSGPGITLDFKQQQGLFRDVVAISTAMRQARMTLYAVDPLGAGQSLLSATYYQTYTKGVANPGQVEIASLSLQVLAEQSGGLVLRSNNDIAAMLRQCLQDTDAYYEVTFDAPPGDKPNEYHHIEMKVDQPGLTARTRDGYYTQP